MSNDEIKRMLDDMEAGRRTTVTLEAINLAREQLAELIRDEAEWKAKNDTNPKDEE